MIPSLTRLSLSYFPRKLVHREPAICLTSNTLLPGRLSTCHWVLCAPVKFTWSCALCGLAFIPEVLTLFSACTDEPFEGQSVVPQTVKCHFIVFSKGKGLHHNISRCDARVVKAQFPEGEGCTVAQGM